MNKTWRFARGNLALLEGKKTDVRLDGPFGDVCELIEGKVSWDVAPARLSQL